jgi:hypothetical protein
VAEGFVVPGKDCLPPQDFMTPAESFALPDDFTLPDDFIPPEVSTPLEDCASAGGGTPAKDYTPPGDAATPAGDVATPAGDAAAPAGDAAAPVTDAALPAENFIAPPARDSVLEGRVPPEGSIALPKDSPATPFVAPAENVAPAGHVVASAQPGRAAAGRLKRKKDMQGLDAQNVLDGHTKRARRAATARAGSPTILTATRP